MSAAGPGRWLDALVRLGARQPLAQPVASDDAAFLQRKGRWRIAWRTLRRMGRLHVSGQNPTLRESIDGAWKRALWIHAEAPQIGDALMDLAPRSLLVERGIEVDLLAVPHVAALFDGDRWLGQVFAEPAAVDPARYDFVIATSHSAAALAPKRLAAPRLPWVSLKGCYLAYDYHRASFVTRRLAELMHLDVDVAASTFHVRQKLDVARPGPLPEAILALDGARAAGKTQVAVAVGGVREERSYAHWAEVMRELHAGGVRSAVLLGSANGRPAAARIVAEAPSGLTVHDLVDRLDLNATQAAMARSRLLLCADGGLMHLGLTTATPVLALFNRVVDPAWRLPPDFEGAALRATSDAVSQIEAGAVATEALRLLARVRG